MDEDKRFRIVLCKTSAAQSKPTTCYDEPVEAIDAVEQYFSAFGSIGKSHAEVYFNGDAEPHFRLFYLGVGRTGIFNTDSCRWPVYFPPGSLESKENMLTEIPWAVDNADEKMEGEGYGTEKKEPPPEKTPGKDHAGSEGKAESEEWPQDRDEEDDGDADGDNADDGEDDEEEEDHPGGEADGDGDGGDELMR
nr:hypothetical protein [Nitrospira sp.]